MLKRKVKLPTTEADYDALVKMVIKSFGLKDAHHAAAIMSVAIRHLPNDQAYTTVDYLGQYITKNIANFVANHKSKLLQHEGEVAQLESILKLNPSDMQAFDALTKAASDGSLAARAALDRIQPIADQNVVSLS